MMKKIFASMIRKSQSDSGDGNLISALLVIPIFLFTALMAIDSGMFFYNYLQVQNIARDGAYNVSTVAGSGNTSRISGLEQAYFRNVSQSGLAARPSAWVSGGGRNLAVNNSMEYGLMETLANANLYNIDITNVQCGVQNSSGSIGVWVNSMNDRPFCRIDWTHSWLGYSLLGVFVDHTNRSTTVNVPAEVIIGPNNTVSRSG